MEQLVPIMDMEGLQKAVNEAAFNGAVKSIQEFYNGYNSPYRKLIDEQLNQKGFSYNIELPDIIAMINGQLSAEVDRISNDAVAKTFVPLVRRFLTRTEPKIFFSEILKEFVKVVKDDRDKFDPSDFECTIKENKEYEWLNVDIGYNDRSYSMTLHQTYESKKSDKVTYQLLSLPSEYESKKSHKSMKISLDGATLEMPFTHNILQDDFLSFIARLVISKPEIIMDTDYFHDEWFYDNDEN